MSIFPLCINEQGQKLLDLPDFFVKKSVTFSSFLFLNQIYAYEGTFYKCVHIRGFIKMADGGRQKRILLVKHDGSIIFLINRKTAMQETVKVRIFSAQDL